MRTESEVIAAIEELQRMGDAACLNGHRPDAQALFDEWMELPSEVAGRIRVVNQRSKGDPAWKRINIQRGNGDRPLANPYQLKHDGKVIRTAAEATELFWGDFSQQILEDTPQARKLDEIGELLLEGAQIELGCCGDENCHGHKIREALIEWVDDGDLPPLSPVVGWLWDLLDRPQPAPVEVEEPEEPWQPPHGCWSWIASWIGRCFDLLRKYWGDFAAFDVEITEETHEHGYKSGRTKAGDAGW